MKRPAIEIKVHCDPEGSPEDIAKQVCELAKAVAPARLHLQGFNINVVADTPEEDISSRIAFWRSMDRREQAAFEAQPAIKRWWHAFTVSPQYYLWKLRKIGPTR